MTFSGMSMKKKKLNVIFDATALFPISQRSCNRSGIFYCAYNILKEMLDRPELNVCLYVSPERYATELQLSRTYFTQATYLHDFSSYFNEAVAKINMLLCMLHQKYYCKKIIRKFIYAFIFLCQKIFVLSVKKNSSFDVALKNADVFFSPLYKVPDFIWKYKNIKPYVFLHDAIPFLQIYEKRITLDRIRSHKKFIDSFNSNTLFFSNSRQTKSDFEKFSSFINDESTTITPLAASSEFLKIVDVDKLNFVKKKYRIPADKKYVFSLCTLEPRKNLLRAVKSFITFVEKHKIKDIVWVLGGASWEHFEKDLSMESKNWSPNLIVQTGFIDDEDMSVLYSNAEWFVYTSQYEGFGLPPLEAMQCGCPVITSNSSSLPEVVGDAGVMIDWDSDEQHVDAYEKYYFNESLRKENGQKGIERAKLFSWKKTVDKMVDVMNSKALIQKDKLNIIYRMCDRVSASSSSKRCFDVDKNQLIKKCLQSLKQNLDNYNGLLDFYCVADNCSDDIIKYLNENFPKVVLKRYEKIGNANSFCKCVEIALNLPNNQQVYFIEDDYLMLKDNVLELLNYNLMQICRELDCKIAIMPDDYPDRYKNNAIDTECRVTTTGHFLKIDKTTCTFATYTDVVKKYKEYFMNFIHWPKVTEDKSVNKVWEKVPLYQPIPAWTLHCQIKSVVPIYLDYVRIKDYFENGCELNQ